MQVDLPLRTRLHLLVLRKPWFFAAAILFLVVAFMVGFLVGFLVGFQERAGKSIKVWFKSFIFFHIPKSSGLLFRESIMYQCGSQPARAATYGKVSLI